MLNNKSGQLGNKREGRELGISLLERLLVFFGVQVFFGHADHLKSNVSTAAAQTTLLRLLSALLKYCFILSQLNRLK